jgi:hypothetical protein
VRVLSQGSNSETSADGAPVAEADASQAVSIRSSPELSEEIRRLITSILSKLLSTADVGDAVSAVEDTAKRVVAMVEGAKSGAGAGGGGGGGAGGKAGGADSASASKMALDIGIAGLKKLVSLCETAVGRNAGHQVWQRVVV